MANYESLKSWFLNALTAINSDEDEFISKNTLETVLSGVTNPEEYTSHAEATKGWKTKLEGSQLLDKEEVVVVKLFFILNKGESPMSIAEILKWLQTADKTFLDEFLYSYLTLRNSDVDKILTHMENRRRGGDFKGDISTKVKAMIKGLKESNQRALKEKPTAPELPGESHPPVDPRFQRSGMEYFQPARLYPGIPLMQSHTIDYSVSFPFLAAPCPNSLFCHILSMEFISSVIIANCHGPEKDHVLSMSYDDAWTYCDEVYFRKAVDELRTIYTKKEPTYQEGYNNFQQNIINGITEKLTPLLSSDESILKTLADISGGIKNLTTQLTSMGKVAPTVCDSRPEFTPKTFSACPKSSSTSEAATSGKTSLTDRLNRLGL